MKKLSYGLIALCLMTSSSFVLAGSDMAADAMGKGSTSKDTMKKSATTKDAMMRKTPAKQMDGHKKEGAMEPATMKRMQ